MSVSGTVTQLTLREAFLGSMGSSTCPACERPPHHLSELTDAFVADASYAPPTGLNRPSIDRLDYPSPSLLVETIRAGSGILTRFPSTYAFRPRLRSRLTLPGRALCRNPWAYGDQVSHPFYRYSCQHQLLSTSSARFRTPSPHRQCSPTTLSFDRPAASVLHFSPVTFSAQLPRPVSYYAFFKG